MHICEGHACRPRILCLEPGARESLLINHAFVDGNKRVAFFATDVFLRLNGWKLATTADDGEQFIVGMLESNNCSFEKIVPWIRRHMVEI